MRAATEVIGMAATDSVVVVLVSLLIGGLGIHVGAILIVGKSEYGSAVLTAILGAIVWGVFGHLFGDVRYVGPALVLLAYLAVIKLRYRASWIEAGGIALVAWIASLAVLWVLAETGWTSFGAVGVPGV